MTVVQIQQPKNPEGIRAFCLIVRPGKGEAFCWRAYLEADRFMPEFVQVNQS
jgi:hypothetical protein